MKASNAPDRLFSLSSESDFHKPVNATYESMNLKISFADTELLEPFGWDFQSCVDACLPYHRKTFTPVGFSHKKKSELSRQYLYPLGEERAALGLSLWEA